MKSGVFRYVESPDFEILLFGFAIDGGPVEVIDLASGEKIPEEILSAISDDSVIKFAHNSSFERICLSRYLGYPTGEYLNPVSWRCTMIWSAYMGLPLSLEGAGAVLGLDKQKLKEGKELIKYFCMPCNPTTSNGGRTRNLPIHAPEKWSAFNAYNIRDVEVEIAIRERLMKYAVPENVWDEYHLDQEINDRGVALDMELVHQAIKMDGQSRTELIRIMREITDLQNPNSVTQMKEWLSDQGLETDSLGKKAVEELLKTAPEPLGKVLSLRQSLAKSSIKKYTAMESAVCSDGRARGMAQYYGANRTGRWAGRLIQIQNLPQNHLEDLEQARSLVSSGNFEAIEMLYNSVPDVLSEIIRTAFIPKPGCKFIVADFSAIEARVIAWLAGEKWRLDIFSSGDDIYCASASQMFRVPVEKNGINGHLRQKGKQAELACIAEGQLVLTNEGLIPIENVTLKHKLWDGESWVSHDGVTNKGEREVITYEGLTATPDHLVWIQGQSQPVQLGRAATSSAHLIQTGNGRTPIRLVGDHLTHETMEQVMEPCLCSDEMCRVWPGGMDRIKQSDKRKIARLSAVFPTKANTQVVGKEINFSKAKMRKSEQQRLSQLWSKGHSIRFPKCYCSWTLSDQTIRPAISSSRNRSNRQRERLFPRKHSLCYSYRKQFKQALYSSFSLVTRILAIFKKRCNSNALRRPFSKRNNNVSRNISIRKTQELEKHQCTTRLYDIRNAAPHHRFTVSGKLVHNCGYGGSVGALKAMGALEMGLAEDELQPLVTAWRTSNPNIVRLWWDVDRAVKRSVKERTATETHGIRFSYQSGMLFILLPSGRRLAYVKPSIGTNQFGSECVTYEGVGSTKKWERIESYGPKFVENIVQAISRDILSYAMKNLRQYAIVMHVHDEIVIEAEPDVSVKDICDIMGQTPSWANGLLLRADGFECNFYQKD